jgi:hypothetical protein
MACNTNLQTDAVMDFRVLKIIVENTISSITDNTVNNETDIYNCIEDLIINYGYSLQNIQDQCTIQNIRLTLIATSISYLPENIISTDVVTDQNMDYFLTYSTTKKESTINYMINLSRDENYRQLAFTGIAKEI